MSRSLVLNASYEPLGTVSERRALMLLLTDVAEMLEEHPDNRYYHSAGGLVVPAPSVVRFFKMKNSKKYSAPKNNGIPSMTKHLVMLRDLNECQVVGCQEYGDTMDHIYPRSLGGGNSWENCVTMCAPHNHSKGSRLLEDLGWELKSVPGPPGGYVMPALRGRPEWQVWLEPFSRRSQIKI